MRETAADDARFPLVGPMRRQVESLHRRLASADGETTVSWVRLFIVSVLLVMVTVRLVRMPYARLLWWEALIGVVAISYSIAVLHLCRRDRCAWWTGYATSLTDVGLLSVLLAGYALLGESEMVSDAPVAFSLFVLAIAATSLRFDHRISWLTGGVAITAYYAVLRLADRFWIPPEVWSPPLAAGVGDHSAALGRLALLAVTTVLAAAFVLRSREMRRQAIEDPLTGLHDRGFFMERWKEEGERALRTGRPLTLAIIDLDDFKLFNDTHGHPAGDRALRHVAELLEENFRASDVVARLGGEEFVVLLPESGVDETVPRLEFFRHRVKNSALWPTDASGPVHVTLSIGVAGWPGSVEHPDELLEKADQALYRAKAEGKDRTVLPPETWSHRTPVASYQTVAEE